MTASIHEISEGDAIQHSKRLAGKYALVTGASRGIGKAVALKYAEEGAKVIALARNVGALEELDDEIRNIGGEEISIVPCDLMEFDAIERLGASLYERYGKLDILVGNAAILGEITPLHHNSPKQWQKVMDINVTANWRLIRSMHPLLERADYGRVIMVTSGVTEGAHPYWGAYATSKAALEMLVKTYATEQKNSAIKANLIDPGVVATAMRKQAFPGEDQTKLQQPDNITEYFVKMAENSFTDSGQKISVG